MMYYCVCFLNLALGRRLPRLATATLASALTITIAIVIIIIIITTATTTTTTTNNNTTGERSARRPVGEMHDFSKKHCFRLSPQ